MAFVDIITGDGQISLVVFANIFKGCKSKLKKDNKIKFKAIKQKNMHRLLEATAM